MTATCVQFTCIVAILYLCAGQRYDTAKHVILVQLSTNDTLAAISYQLYMNDEFSNEEMRNVSKDENECRRRCKIRTGSRTLIKTDRTKFS